MRHFILLVAACTADAPVPVDPPSPPGSDTAQDTDVPTEPAARTLPLPVTGGTLLALADGRFAASDPDGDRVALVDASPDRVDAAFVDLPAGAWPFRLAEGGDGVVRVTARGRGSVFEIAPDGRILAEIPVCAEPRGLAGTADGAVVACAGGELVRIAGGAVADTWLLDGDLRDVVPMGDGWWVSRFRTAEILVVDAAGAVTGRLAPPVIGGSAPSAAFPATVAWRMVADPAGGALLAHQRSSPDVVDLGVGFGLPAYGGAACDAVVQTGLTRFAPDGSAVTTGAVLKAALPVDVAVDGDGATWLVSAGADGMNDVAVGNVSEGLYGLDGCNFIGGLPWGRLTGAGGGRMVAVAPGPGFLLVQSQPFSLAVAVGAGVTARLDVPSELDPTGHALFHVAPTGTMACASCHPEGREDGRTWRFEQGHGEELRRTQSLAGGVGEPLHWRGEHADMDALLVDTFERRMGAEAGSTAAEDFAAFLASIPAVPSSRAAPPPAFAAGGCDTCHAGPALTDEANHDVGTTDHGVATSFQTPTLLGVGARGPWMHDGCADTLAERFDPACGGASHGNPLTPEQVDELVGWLATL